MECATDVARTLRVRSPAAGGAPEDAQSSLTTPAGPFSFLNPPRSDGRSPRRETVGGSPWHFPSVRFSRSRAPRGRHMECAAYVARTLRVRCPAAGGHPEDAQFLADDSCRSFFIPQTPPLGLPFSSPRNCWRESLVFPQCMFLADVSPSGTAHGMCRLRSPHTPCAVPRRRRASGRRPIPR